ncbi:NAD-dependent epimerase/dehydratase family protein, partial [candidate division KSB1 bacterium]|nr:NAD-dependent epimerase/dehydratase family protein [candidate division KSB1 bacterium]
QSVYNAYSGACRIFCVSQFFNQQPPIYEDGQQLRDFVNVHDVVAANIAVLESPKSNYHVYNVGGGKGYTVKEFSDIVTDIFGKNIQGKITNEFRYGDTRHIFSDVSNLRELGWKPQYTPRDSVQEYVSWLENLEDIDNILEETANKMKKLNVVRKTKKKSGKKNESISTRGRSRLKASSYNR